MIIEVNTRYQLLHNSVGVLHKFIGPAYFDTILNPEIGAESRAVVARYTAQEVYTSRDRIQQEIRDEAQRILGDKLNKLVQPAAVEEADPQHYDDFLSSSILVLDTLVLGIELPPPIVAAINRQTEQFYMIQEYKFRVEREAEESRRKMVEANGIAAFQRTVSQGISDSYLRWQGINATLALAQSPNTKIVIVGSGKDGLPIILGNVDSPVAGAPVKPDAPPGTAGHAGPRYIRRTARQIILGAERIVWRAAVNKPRPRERWFAGRGQWAKSAVWGGRQQRFKQASQRAESVGSAGRWIGAVPYLRSSPSV